MPVYRMTLADFKSQSLAFIKEGDTIEIIINYENSVTCKQCGGTGEGMPEGCDTCDSNGWVHDPSDGGTMTCPDCDGLAGEPCDAPNCEEGKIYGTE